ncbi:DUF995 domain-containing protein [Mesorhizobium sp. M1C.F.Ca.ET.193.01.1.1]|uniref:DUF995 domain-containing protein n=1 Tax=unclassified Mesorhizobium TaxID=325217 RepID=UPI000FD3D06E|nr:MULTISPECIES: DUF995 domain-containing protein [unclassified Mesorhizobium]TGQ68036.1 DUF995 domain-containing protein [Mesorhizobium sp. M1C.F.Ca.ET.212.01.1.1]TGR79337.1 DUF995 domain-containing protein [Mesorhizobium sp. M1C.F.Ca.ET.193.01.1.1]TGS95646.1 DUF995 domain-containing protein [bacterium M00.F.Ca.ET.177.01.1.1]TGQ51718.1 DUF995 domain-containing protein [Mesorhizobium sp. M1C.F.Ca.ET.210.01.1.1]TGR03037.1 DUF995 domain-containing protein [Mesorhizobium sp. M1C.F.Ca.ET.204.01.1.
MKRVVGNLVGAALACSVFVIGSQAPATAKAANKADDQASRAAALSDAGIYQLYQNHSWLWGKTGTAFFSAKQRQFDTWTSDKGKPGYGDGIWFIPGGGKVCYRATWHGGWGSKKSMTCFEHRQAGNVIYQRKLPDGEWYAFKDRHGLSKLRYGDYASGKMKRIKAKL